MSLEAGGVDTREPLVDIQDSCGPGRVAVRGVIVPYGGTEGPADVPETVGTTVSEVRANLPA